MHTWAPLSDLASLHVLPMHTIKPQALQQQAEGLVAAISKNQQSKAATQQQLQELEQQLQEQQSQCTAAREQLQLLQEQHQQVQQQVAAAELQLAECEKQKQQVAADVSEKQHALQVTRGECATAQDKLSQVCCLCLYGLRRCGKLQMCKSIRCKGMLNSLSTIPSACTFVTSQPTSG